MWELWKKAFDGWETNTATLLEKTLRSPAVLAPVGHLLTAAMKAKSASDSLVHRGWSALGLPTRRDQQRTLHALNELQSRLLDLEDRLDNRRREEDQR